MASTLRVLLRKVGSAHLVGEQEEGEGRLSHGQEQPLPGRPPDLAQHAWENSCQGRDQACLCQRLHHPPSGLPNACSLTLQILLDRPGQWLGSEPHV